MPKNIDIGLAVAVVGSIVVTVVTAIIVIAIVIAIVIVIAVAGVIIIDVVATNSDKSPSYNQFKKIIETY